MNLFKIKRNPKIVQLDRTTKTLVLDTQYLFLACTILLASILIRGINSHYFHFTGNDYIYAHSFFSVILYCLINIMGCYLLEEFNRFTSIFVDILLIIITYLIVAFATNAIQLTPFLPIDDYILKFEFLKLENTVDFFNHHHFTRDILIFLYNSLGTMMYILPLSLALIRRRQEIHNFCRYILVGVLIGFTFYFFFPSCGPASIFSSHLFMQEQHANHIKFWEIHQGIQPTTINGGLIALPSFHVIWAWACCRVAKTVHAFMYYPLLIWFILVSLSCFVLGWHYSIDILTSLIIILCLEKIWATEVAP